MFVFPYAIMWWSINQNGTPGQPAEFQIVHKLFGLIYYSSDKAIEYNESPNISVLFSSQLVPINLSSSWLISTVLLITFIAIFAEYARKGLLENDAAASAR